MNARLFFVAILLLGIGGRLAASNGPIRFITGETQDQSQTYKQASTSVAPGQGRSPRLEVNMANTHTIDESEEEGQGQSEPSENPSPIPTSEPVPPTPAPTSQPTRTPQSTPRSTPCPRSAENFVLSGSMVGFIRLAGAGVSVTRGASATLRFSLTITALQANVLASNDKTFRETLMDEEVGEYERLVNEYSEGLDVPFLEFLGANLQTNVTRDDQEEASRTRRNYNRQAEVAGNILREQPRTRVTVSGERTVTGTSFVPTTFFAFVKAAQVTLADGSTVLVVSTSPDDLAVATSDGVVLITGPSPTGSDTFSVVNEPLS